MIELIDLIVCFRRISTRGDCNYRTDSSVQTYFKVFAQATVMVANNFKDGNCGGRRLNQYSITMNIMLEPPAPAAPGASGAISGGGVLGGAGSGGLGKSLFNRSAFPPAFSAMEDQTWGDFERSGFAGGASSAESDLKYPLFSTAAYSELDVRISIIFFPSLLFFSIESLFVLFNYRLWSG